MLGHELQLQAPAAHRLPHTQHVLVVRHRRVLDSYLPASVPALLYNATHLLHTPGPAMTATTAPQISCCI